MQVESFGNQVKHGGSSRAQRATGDGGQHLV
jgi:hypothetical protein